MNGVTDRLGQPVATLTRLLISPGSNRQAAYALYGIIAALLLIVLVVGLMIVLAAPEDEVADAAIPDKRKDARDTRRAARPKNPRARLLLGLGIVVLLAGAWVAAGFTTSDPGMCKSCHWPASEHAKADKDKDPHGRVDCVACHEAGGVIGRYVTDVPLRVLHIAIESVSTSSGAEYGRITARACTSCHSEVLLGTSTNLERWLKMSHAEPLAASASCVDCHAMRGGIVSVHNTGMTPCLRCHNDAKASTACTTCHVGNTSAAVRVRTISFRREQVAEVSCGGCHNEKQKCDPCHGTRMPHTTVFKAGAHARAGAVDSWYNGGKACGRCHTASRNPCGRCHSTLLGKAHGNSLATGHQGGVSPACDTCHQQYATIATRDFCKDVCHSPAAIEASPR